MTRRMLLRCTVLLLSTAACAGHVGTHAARPDHGMRQALTARYGEPNVFWAFDSTIRIEYDTDEYDAQRDPGAAADRTGRRATIVFESLARSIARTAVGGAGKAVPSAVEVVLHERQPGSNIGSGSQLNAPMRGSPTDHTYRFRGEELASR